MKFLKWSDDNFRSTQGSYLAYDKLEHFLLGFLGLCVTLFFFDFLSSIIVWLSLGIAWEIKDGLLTYDGKNVQGFSWGDLIADCLGFVLAIILYTIINRIYLHF